MIKVPSVVCLTFFYCRRVVMVSCYFGCRSILCYLLRREALGRGISFAAIAVLNVYTNSSSLLYHRHRGRSLPSCRLGLYREGSTFSPCGYLRYLQAILHALTSDRYRIQFGRMMYHKHAEKRYFDRVYRMIGTSFIALRATSDTVDCTTTLQSRYWPLQEQLGNSV